MDHIKKYQFWYCFAAAVVLIPLGWWMGTSKLAAQTQAQIEVINGADNGIPVEVKNEKWKEELSKVNKTRAEIYYQHAQSLFEAQQSTLKWPSGVANVMKDAEFFGPGKDEKVRSTYRTVYDADCERVWRLVDPVIIVEREAEDGPEKGERIFEVTGDVAYPYSEFHRVDRDLWRFPPTWEQMWEAQMDNWLMTALLQSIERVNDERGAKNVFDASIRQIELLELRGGSRDAEGQPITAAAAGGGGEEAAMSESGDSGEGAGAGLPKTIPGLDDQQNDGRGGGGGTRRFGRAGMTGGSRRWSRGESEGGGRGGAGGAGMNVNTIAQQVLGIPAMRESAEGAGGGGEEAAMSEEGGGGGAMPLGAGGKLDPQKYSPYVDNDPEMPFKTRGFVLQVVMKRKDVPLLVKELTNAEKTKFPTEILWLSSTDLHTDFTGDEVLSEWRSRAVADRGRDADSLGGLPIPGLMKQGLTRPRAYDNEESRGGFSRGFGRQSRPMGRDREGGRNNGAGGQSAGYEAALNDIELSQVLVVGVMTIYQPPKKPEILTEEAGKEQPGDPVKTPAEDNPANRLKGDPDASDEPSDGDDAEPSDAKDAKDADAKPKSDPDATPESEKKQKDDADPGKTPADNDAGGKTGTG